MLEPRDEAPVPGEASIGCAVRWGERLCGAGRTDHGLGGDACNPLLEAIAGAVGGGEQAPAEAVRAEHVLGGAHALHHRPRRSVRA